MVTACPSARSALGSAAETSARPPTLTNGASSVVTKVISIGGRLLAQIAPPPQACRPARCRAIRARPTTCPCSARAASPTGRSCRVFRVPPEVAGQRLDVFVQSQLHRTSRTRAQAIVRASAYDAQRPAPQAERPRARRAADPALARRRGTRRRSPSTCPSLRGRAPARGRQAGAPAGAPDGALPQEHAHQGAPGRAPGRAFLSLGHRLDRETSGVMLVVQDARVRPRAEEAARGARRTSRRRTSRSPGASPTAATARARFRFERSMELDLDGTAAA